MMKPVYLSSFDKNLEPHSDKVQTKLVLDTAFTKEIRIQMRSGQKMKEHKTPFPIIIHILEGAIELGVEGESVRLNKGGLIGLDGGIPHDLFATRDSVIRLSLSMNDDANRVEKVAHNS